MTRVRFYHNARDAVALACELVAKAYAGGRRIAVRLPDPGSARRLDQMLWSFDQLAFIPHVPSDSPLAAETAVVLGHAGDGEHWPHEDLLFNLAPDVPHAFDRFRMLVEVVGQGDDERNPARARWMQYKAAGLSLEAFDAERREAI